MNTVRKEVKQRRARLINQQDHIAFLECRGCPKRRAYDPTRRCIRPFFGSGTTGLVALKHGRNLLGLN